MCYVCLGERIDPSTGRQCLRCEGTGVDPDPHAYDFSAPVQAVQ